MREDSSECSISVSAKRGHLFDDVTGGDYDVVDDHLSRSLEQDWRVTTTTMCQLVFGR